MYEMLLNAVQTRSEPLGKRTLLLSINPDLKSDFGHFLNYEKRINDLCGNAHIFHHCLSNIKFQTTRPFISGVFEQDSGHYCLYRKGASGHEVSFTAELHKIITDWMARNRVVEIFERIIVFIYQSSSRSAAYLSCLEWPKNTKVIANGFWDFLIPHDAETELDIARLKLQSAVEFLAMSTSHRKIIRDQYGHDFKYIPNPPPLVSDKLFSNLLRQSYATKTVRERAEKVVFFPGLMTVGKGSGITVDVLRQVDAKFPDSAIVARDRSDSLKNALSGMVGQRLCFASGDFSDTEIINLYDDADVAVLPYSSEVFRFRTSGALVDCLMSSTVPVVFPDTWLAEMCVRYDFGVVAAGETADDLIKAVQFAVQDVKRQLQRMITGALRYAQDNSWQAFIDTLVPVVQLVTSQRVSEVAVRSGQVGDLDANVRALNTKGSGSAKHRFVAGDLTNRSASGGSLFKALSDANGGASAKLLLTSIGNGLLIAAADQLDHLQRDQKLSEAVRRALIDLPDDDPHKGQFLRVWARFGDKSAAHAT